MEFRLWPYLEGGCWAWIRVEAGYDSAQVGSFTCKTISSAFGMLLALLLALSLALSSGSIIVQASSSMFTATSLAFAPRSTQVHREASELVQVKHRPFWRPQGDQVWMAVCLSVFTRRQWMHVLWNNSDVFPVGFSILSDRNWVAMSWVTPGTLPDWGYKEMKKKITQENLFLDGEASASQKLSALII